MIIRTLLASGMLLSIASASMADSNEPGRQQRFKAMDSDKNGFVSQYETRGKHLIFYYYPQADLNSDGHIDMQEFREFEKKYPHTAKSKWTE